MSAGGWAALIGIGVLGLVVLGMVLHRYLAETPTEREQALQTQLQAMKAANLLGQAYFQAQAQMRSVARGRPSGPVIDGEVIDKDYV